MLRFLSLLSALLMSCAPSLFACEGCREAADVTGASGTGGIGASFSWSVLFMVGMSAFLISGLVVMMIRSCRQLAAQHQRVAGESPWRGEKEFQKPGIGQLPEPLSTGELPGSFSGGLA